jgi:hypothetical protein
MSRLPHYTAVAVFTAMIAATGADAAINHNRAARFTGAHNAVSHNAQSGDDILRQCSEQARSRYPSSNQEMQTNRDYAWRTCMYDHGVHNP